MGPESGQQVQLTSLASRLACAAEIRSIEGRRLHLTLRGQFSRGDLARVEGPDWLVLGEVVRFEPGEPASAVVLAEHTLLNTGELVRRREIWLR